MIANRCSVLFCLKEMFVEPSSCQTFSEFIAFDFYRKPDLDFSVTILHPFLFLFEYLSVPQL